MRTSKIATTRLRFPQVASTACCAVPLRSADADGEDAGAGSGQDGNVEKLPFRCWKITCVSVMKFHVKNVKKPWNSRFETKRVKQELELSNLPHLSSSFTWFNFYRRRSLWPKRPGPYGPHCGARRDVAVDADGRKPCRTPRGRPRLTHRWVVGKQYAIFQMTFTKDRETSIMN